MVRFCANWFFNLRNFVTHNHEIIVLVRVLMSKKMAPCALRSMRWDSVTDGQQNVFLGNGKLVFQPERAFNKNLKVEYIRKYEDIFKKFFCFWKYNAMTMFRRRFSWSREKRTVIRVFPKVFQNLMPFCLATSKPIFISYVRVFLILFG